MDLIPQCAPLESYRKHATEIDAAIKRVLESGWYILGSQVDSFEKQFAEFNNSKFCVSVASGTDALILSLKALDIGARDGVITVSHTAVATVAAIEATGAVPVFIDIDETTFNLDVSKLEEFLRKFGTDFGGVKIKAIIPVHIYGHPCNMTEIKNLADRFDLAIIEDCAQAHGAAIDGTKVGNYGQVGAFSFYPTKNLGAIGDGGGIVTNDERIYGKLLELRQYGWKKRYISDSAGYNSRLDELQAAILCVKLKYLSEETAKRKSIAARYVQGLKDFVETPVENDKFSHVFHLFVIRSPYRSELQAYLNTNRIQTAIHYPQPIHSQPAYSKRALAPFQLEVTESAASTILSLPLYPELSLENVNRVIDCITNFK